MVYKNASENPFVHVKNTGLGAVGRSEGAALLALAFLFCLFEEVLG